MFKVLSSLSHQKIRYKPLTSVIKSTILFLLYFNLKWNIINPWSLFWEFVYFSEVTGTSLSVFMKGSRCRQSKTTTQKFRHKKELASFSWNWKLSYNIFQVLIELKDILRKFVSTLSELMKSPQISLLKWAKENGLGVNSSKIELVLFTRKYKHFSLYHLDGFTPELSNEGNYLGMTLGSKLSWKRNTKRRMQNALLAFYTCILLLWTLQLLEQSLPTKLLYGGGP